MKIRRLMKDEKGAVLPLVALFIFLVALGVTALVIDVGMMYSERRTMVAAADAGALAGARDLTSASDLKSIVKISRKVAIRNGSDDSGHSEAQLDGLIVVSGTKATLDDGKLIVKVDRSNINSYNRPYVEVKTNKNTNHYFAQIFGESYTDVKAEAVATYDSFKDFVLPLAANYSDFYRTSDTYNIGVPVFLHESKPQLPGDVSWSGMLDINGDGKAQIVNIFKDRQEFSIEHFLYIDEGIPYIDTAQGWKNLEGALNGTEALIAKSATKSVSERQGYVTGYIPVTQNIKAIEKDKRVPIQAFAEFVIVDYASNNKGEWMTINYDHYLDNEGNIFVKYNNYLSDKPIVKYEHTDTVMGYFTGKFYEMSEIMRGRVYLFK